MLFLMVSSPSLKVPLSFEYELSGYLGKDQNALMGNVIVTSKESV